MPLSIVGKGALGLITLGAWGAYEMAPPDMGAQTSFLERLATRLQCAQQIPPETHLVLSDILNRIGHQRLSGDRPAELEGRRQLAIAKIANVLRETTVNPGDLRTVGNCRRAGT
jgi:hypothetical protein